MPDKILTDYKSPVISEGLRDTLLSFMPPGRYNGFDQMVAGSTGADPIKAKIQHETTVKLQDTVEYASFFSPQGLLIYTTDTIETSLPANAGADYNCYLVYSRVSLDTSIPENSSFVLSIDPSPTTVADYSTVDMVSLLPNTDLDVALGLIIVPGGVSDIGGCIYVQYAQQPFGYETAASEELAWRTKDNNFFGANSVNPTSAALPADVVGSILVLRGTNAYVSGTNATSIGNFQRYAEDGVTPEAFPVGTTITVTFNHAGPTFDAESASNIYIPGEPSAYVITPGAYTFILNSAGKWFLISSFADLHVKKITKVTPSWINLPVITTGIFNGGLVQYYLDSDGQVHVRAWVTAVSTLSVGADTVLHSTSMYLAPFAGVLQLLTGWPADVSSWVTTPRPFIFKLGTDGFLYVAKGSAIITTDTIYMGEMIFTP